MRADRPSAGNSLFDPGARVWQMWKVPAAIRFSRFFGVIR